MSRTNREVAMVIAEKMDDNVRDYQREWLIETIEAALAAKDARIERLRELAIAADFCVKLCDPASECERCGLYRTRRSAVDHHKDLEAP